MTPDDTYDAPFQTDDTTINDEIEATETRNESELPDPEYTAEYTAEVEAEDAAEVEAAKQAWSGEVEAVGEDADEIFSRLLSPIGQDLREVAVELHRSGDHGRLSVRLIFALELRVVSSEDLVGRLQDEGLVLFRCAEKTHRWRRAVIEKLIGKEAFPRTGLPPGFLWPMRRFRSIDVMAPTPILRGWNRILDC